ncbi:SPBc2 prophage-derived DNA ligase-like protein LigB [Paenibacillus glycanilyticus]|uniref:SPBc2 prophage-derived DNA ligase-like protein LigB n=1 Tax=Paenibacillus glycanilyticus TaxID=126569 RepID=A0ABQ6NVK8_9BACL|nr:RNA ligase family protein [Paenibacillus glycanilyticus]GMK49141.1 SPBc2 prophage-derived DNA ligase-like protein LigB [Paenibacillus glycanilyticus]
MLLQYAVDNMPFDKEHHVAELKLDGIRMIISTMDGLRLYTRHQNDVTNKFPELHDTPLPPGTVLDGELIVSDKQGKPDFEATMSRFQSRSSRAKATFCAFDIIRYKGIDVTGLPLSRRKELLYETFTETERYTKVRPAIGSTIQYYEAVSAQGLEGIVIKDLRSKYAVNTRSWAWQKVINWTYADVFITGMRQEQLGWLAAIEENGRIRPAGIIEFGINSEHKQALRSIQDKLVYKEDQFAKHFRPLIRARVKTRNWTKNGMLRSPVFEEFIL